MEPFEGLDFYNIESLLTEEEIMVRDMVREWVTKPSFPRLSRLAKKASSSMNGELPSEKWACWVHRSRATDAPGFPMSPTAHLPRTGARRQWFAFFASVQGSLAMYPIWDFGTEEQKEKYLRRWHRVNGSAVSA